MNIYLSPEERDLILLALRTLARMAEMKAEYESAARLIPLIERFNAIPSSAGAA